MKTIKQVLVALIIILTFAVGCNSDDPIAEIMDPPSQGEDPDPNPDPDPQPTGEFEMVDVQTILPDGVDLDLTEAVLFTLATAESIDSQGKATVPYNTGLPEIAYLLDSEDNLLMAGFLTDDRKEISIKTTTEVMLFFGMSSFLRSKEYKDFFVKEIQNINGFDVLSTAIENLFQENPLMFTEGSYTTLISNKIEEIVASELINVDSKISVGAIASSGLELNELGDKTFSISNSYPRRTHAFLYKKSFKSGDGNETILHPEIDGNDASDNDFILPFVTLQGETNTEGDVYNYNLCTQGSRYEAKTSDEIDLILLENQTSAIYEVSVVGPGVGTDVKRSFTNAEQSKFESLSTETFILDYFLPILMDMSGNRALLVGVADNKIAPLVNVVEPILKEHQASMDAVLANDFRTALDEFLPFLYQDIRLSNDLREILRGIYATLSDGGTSPNTFIQGSELIEEGEPRYLKVITSISTGFQNSIGLNCINQRIESSNPIETWDIMVSEGKVKLTPEQVVASPYGQPKPLTAKTTVDLDTGDQLEYEWSTTAQFGGFLNDQNGQTGAFITTSQSSVLYQNAASNSQLSDGDNLEQIEVIVYIVNANGRQEVDKDTIEVNVKKNKFYISPDEISIDGNKSVSLRLHNNDRETTIPNSNTDYKVVWTTPGSFGLFNGINTTETKTNNNRMVYKAMDEDVERGTENIRAVIYGRPKNTTLSYRLVDEVDAKIYVENDEFKKTYPIRPVLIETPPHLDDSGIYCEYSVQMKFEFSPEDSELLAAINREVVQYQLVIKESIPDANPTYVGTGQTWFPENAETDLENGMYVYPFGGTGSQGGAQACSDGTAQGSYEELLALYQSFDGLAEITVTLRKKE